MKASIVVFAEGELSGVYTARSAAENNAFIAGFGQGAHAYGAGSVAAFVMPEGEDDMKRTFPRHYEAVMKKVNND